MTITAPSIEDLKAGFTFQRFTTITGKPTSTTIARLEIEAIRNAATVECRVPKPHTNLCSIVKQDHTYLLCVGKAFTKIPYPGNQPIFVDKSSTSERKEVQGYYNMNLRLDTTIQRLENILKSMIENAINVTYLAGIHTPEHRFGKQKIIDIFLWL